MGVFVLKRHIQPYVSGNGAPNTFSVRPNIVCQFFVEKSCIQTLYVEVCLSFSTVVNATMCIVVY